MKLWGGRFAKPADQRAEEFTASISFDRRLYREDIVGSMAHVKMLGEVGILSSEDAALIRQGLGQVLEEIEGGKFPFRREFEDIHLNIEKRLAEIIGPVAGKMHTARSRNDQIALDEHLFIREACARVGEAITSLQSAILDVSERHKSDIVPGYTHTQRAQPTLFAHHYMAYFFMLQRDYERFSEVSRHVDVMPLGAGALAGTTFPIDPGIVAKELGFSRVYENSMDAVSNRDHIIEFLSSCAILAMHLSRLSEELVYWSSTEFGFVEMDDAYSTGSSMMPQKKNPDVLELIRGKTGRIYGHLMGVLTMMKGTLLAYDSDMQEDKEPLFDAFDTVTDCTEIAAAIVKTMKVNPARMREAATKDFSTATDVADYLAGKGLPFREAHEVAGKVVRECIEKGKFLGDLSLSEFRKHSELFQDDVFDVITLEAVVSRRRSPGGTAPERVAEQMAIAHTMLDSRGRA